MQERSFTVPQILSLPIFPPANSYGGNYKAVCGECYLALFHGKHGGIIGGQVRVSEMLLKNTVDKLEVCFPPAPWARVTNLSVIIIPLFG